jgi:hypothetical protein
MTAGRPIRFPPCPLCQQPVKSASSPYFKCGCRRYIVRDGVLCPARPRAKPKPVEVLLSRDKEGRVTGVWRIDWEATRHYSTPRVEKEAVYCTADEYESLQS